ncbi:MAG: tetratricopeptide repeat protein [Rhodospirillaceae bacterium]
MLQLRLLMVPVFTGLAAFTLAIFNNVDAVNFESLNVPGSAVGNSGITADFLIKTLVDRMEDIEAQAQSRADATPVVVQDDGGSAAVLGQYFGLTPLLHVVQTSFGLIPHSFSGEIVVQGKEMEMVLRGQDNSHRESLIRTSAAVGDIDTLVTKTAYELMRVVDPTLLASYQFKKDYLTRDFTGTEEVIRRALAADEVRHHKWVMNLWGIVLYQEADFEGAIDKFRQAAELDPSFTSPVLNWGVVLLRQGKRDEAITKFQQVIQLWRRGGHADVLAAAYTEWGFALALMGRTRDAEAKFKQAAATDPTFSDVYSAWAEVLAADGRGDEAQAMTVKALKLTPVEKVFTDNLVGRIKELPAAASGVSG